MNPYKRIAKNLKWIKSTFKNAPKFSFPLSTKKSIQESESPAERHERITREMLEVSTALAKRGWYTNMDMPFQFLFSLNRLLKANKSRGVDKMMVTYLQQTFEEVENGILSAFPLRAQILSAAFRAHSKKAYTLSVPVFLAQADGICSELLGVGVYSRKKGVPHTASTVEQFKHDKLLFALLEPLRVAGALNAYEDEKHEYPDILNRHEVLHGKSLDYATELNSFRAISLLSYLCSVVQGAFWLEEVSKEMEESKQQQAKI